MLLFRSEEHVDRWCQQWGRVRGGTMTMQQGWELAKAWYADRLRLDWRRKTPAEAAKALTDIGLEGEFWRL
jgi:hypothetical protein